MSPGRGGPRTDGLALAAPIALVLAATALAFSPILRNRFVNWDDLQNLVYNPSYRGLGAEQIRWMFTTFHLGHYQPLAWLTLGADYVVWGMNPFGYHLTSLLFHLANALLVYALARELTRRAERESRDASAIAISGAAAFAAGLFALHPLRVESVAWATARRDVVSGFFFLVSVLTYVRSVERPGRRADRVVSVAAFALAALSKEIVATLPVLLLILDVYPLRRFRPERTLRLVVEKFPYFALSIAIAIAGFAGQRATQAVPGLREYGFIDRAAIAAYGLAFYVRKTIVPASLSPAHVLPADFRATAAPFVASALFVAAAAAALAASRRRARALVAASAAYAASLLPVLGIVQVWRQIVAERYSYLACLGFAFLGAGALLNAERWRGGRARGVARLAAVALLLVLALLSARQARVWRTPETLWQSALAADPKNYLALYNLGVDLVLQGRFAEARTAYEAALALKPDDSETLGGLGAIALNEGRLDDAGPYLERAVALGPWNGIALTNLGILRSRRGDKAGAESAYRAALALKPDNAEAIGSLGALALNAGRLDDAVGYLERSIVLWPENAIAHTNLGILRLRMGDRDGAIVALSTATRLTPTLADAWKNLGVALEGGGHFAESAAAFREYVRLRPDDRDARRSLASDLMRAGQEPEAVRVARESLARDSTDWASANFLAWALATSADDTLRDAALAVVTAERALATAGPEPDPNLLDTYGAALAAAGRYDDAIAAARRAATSAAARGDSALAREARARLALYEKRVPYRSR